MANEIIVTVKGKIEPDLTNLVKRTQHKYPDWLAEGEDIPAKSTAYALSERYGHKLYKRYTTVENFAKHLPNHPPLKR